MKKALACIMVIGFTVTTPACTILHEIQPTSKKDRTVSMNNNSITYIGHATVLIHLDSLSIMTDPMFNDYLGYFAKRYIKPGISFENLPPIDVILISHEHYDHLHEPSLERFPKDIIVIISKGLGETIRKLGFKDVREMDWWESTMIKGVNITAVPAKHIFSKPSGYIMQGTKTVFFAGDTGLFDEFTEIGNRFNIDISLLPIGDYYPYLWFIPGFVKMTRERHMAPNDVPKALEMLRTKSVVPIHWGTFKVSGTDLHEPLEWLKQIITERKLQEKVLILPHGESMTF
ncbi:MAG: MBL fold metallo-hydrolase [Ignavibacteriales bacterium]|nr:MBL fold metallo-hydrolase [Ignavibacteriales bacterium]